MNDQVNYMTSKGYNNLKKILDFLITVKRRKIAKALEHAISLGDNVEYKAARDEQSLNEIRITELKTEENSPSGCCLSGRAKEARQSYLP